MRVVLRKCCGRAVATAAGRVISGSAEDVSAALELASRLLCWGGRQGRGRSLCVFEVLGREQVQPIISTGVSVERIDRGNVGNRRVRVRVANDSTRGERLGATWVACVFRDVSTEATRGKP